jgi:phage anti-repressor protein
MNELVQVIVHNDKDAVSARHLFDILEFKDNNFTRFCNRYILKNEFAVEGVDYEHLVHRTYLPNNAMRDMKDYALSFDFTKRLCMLSKTAKGKEIRQWFIEREKKLQVVEKAIPALLSPEELIVAQAKIMLDHRNRLTKVESDIRMLQAQTTTRPDYFTIVGYSTLVGKPVTLEIAKILGKKASVICNSLGVPMGDCPDPRFGRVRTYPRRVLERVFGESYQQLLPQGVF